MSLKAVITGDIIKSSIVKDEEYKILIDAINKTFEEIKVSLDIDIKYEIWRGDSFQAVIQDAKQALKAAILFRAGLKSKTPEEFSKTWDARLSIGIGDISFEGESVASSNGEAFVLSGHKLDELTENKVVNLAVNTKWKDINDEFLVSVSLADVIITDWTKKQAEAISFFLVKSETQEVIAQRLNISQAALSKRINKQGKLFLILLLVERFEKLIEDHGK